MDYARAEEFRLNNKKEYAVLTGYYHVYRSDAEDELSKDVFSKKAGLLRKMAHTANMARWGQQKLTNNR